MTQAKIADLRHETVEMFYHGFDNYMAVAFPEDELRPISCVPLTRDPFNPRHVELNDVLGNYSLTLIDSLSTLAILASAPADRYDTGPQALLDFQNGIAALVLQYGDGTEGPSGQGLRGRGFDVDSKVQVFETVIRGVGGLLSAHLFAAGELPIRGYEPRMSQYPLDSPRSRSEPIPWANDFQYDGQLLRLAFDLGERLLPAFFTNTGMPYPRVNLRHGIPFYTNSPLHEGVEQIVEEESPEITETCSAGAGSLVLEFTTLSRLTGDERFEQLAKRAFWAVWMRRSEIGLIGAGVDAEGGQWIGPYAGIGAGADSFFEYALKTHILLSGTELPNLTIPDGGRTPPGLDPNTIYRPLSEEENSPESFLYAWQAAHAAIKRHLYSDTVHPHYVNAHLSTGSPQAYWIDSLGAYYPGLLTLAGELDEAIETHLLYTALWTRYAALPERWSVRDGHVEGGLGWWPGRPEFIESNYHLYRATKDPWFLHVGEMVLKDIQQRCWTECGWAGLQDVRTGEKSDRMESFFLGETAKYMYLMYDSDHPLNSLDAPYVFTTEGHPLIIPRKSARTSKPQKRESPTSKDLQKFATPMNTETCPVPPAHLPLSISVTAARPDLFHAASLTALHTIPNYRTIDDGFSITIDPDAAVHANHTYYPWTLPMRLVPSDATCAPMIARSTFSIEFPATGVAVSSIAPRLNVLLGTQSLTRIHDGILAKNLGGLRILMVKEELPSDSPTQKPTEAWRVMNIGTVPMGRDEKLYVPRDIIASMSDPAFTRIRNSVMLDVVLQIENTPPQNDSFNGLELLSDLEFEDLEDVDDILVEHAANLNFDQSSLSDQTLPSAYRTMLSSLLSQVTSVLRDPAATLLPRPQSARSFRFISLPAASPTGAGAAPIVDVVDAPDPSGEANEKPLSWETMFFAGEACDGKLPDEAVKKHQVIVMKRGGCTFSRKLANVPAFTPTYRGFKFLIMVSDDEEGADLLVRPLLDELQYTPAGLLRHHQISMALVGGGEHTYELLRRAHSVGIRRRYHVESNGILIHNLVVV